MAPGLSQASLAVRRRRNVVTFTTNMTIWLIEFLSMSLVRRWNVSMTFVCFRFAVSDLEVSDWWQLLVPAW